MESRSITTLTPAELTGYVIGDETHVVAVRKHWLTLVEPWALVLLSIVVFLYADLHATPGNTSVRDWLFVAIFLLIVRGIYYTVLWYKDWFAVTNRRLLLTEGVVWQKVSMMPLAKVTDMSFTRTVPGRVFGYGRFVLESAGQDQALRSINYVPHPDYVYRLICTELFGRDSYSAPGNPGGPAGGPSPRGGGPGGSGGPGGAGPGSGPGGGWHDTWDEGLDLHGGTGGYADRGQRSYWRRFFGRDEPQDVRRSVAAPPRRGNRSAPHTPLSPWSETDWAASGWSEDDPYDADSYDYGATDDGPGYDDFADDPATGHVAEPAEYDSFAVEDDEADTPASHDDTGELNAPRRRVSAYRSSSRPPARRRRDEGESLYRSDDLVQRDRSADTRPVPIMPRRSTD